MKEKIERLTLSATAILSVLVALADFLGVLDSVPRLAERIPSLLLLLLGIVAGYLALERRGVLDKMNTSIANLEDQYAQTNAFFNALRQRDHFTEVLLVYGVRAYGKLLSDRRVVVERQDVLKLFRDCIAGSRRWLGTTYVLPDEAWDLEWGSSFVDGIQRERIRAGGTIKRVFILKDAQEYEKVSTTMKVHQGIGIDVKWILYDTLMQNKLVREYRDTLGTVDFAVVDDSWVLLFYLDLDRRLTRAEALQDSDMVDRATFVFNEAFGRGAFIRGTELESSEPIH